MTTVYQLGSDNQFCYSLPPDQAVVAAFEQYHNYNFNTWSYLPPEQHPQYRRTALGNHSCGDYTAFHSLNTNA